MIVRPMEFGMIQQQNTVSQVRHNEDVRPMVEQQTAPSSRLLLLPTW